MGCTKRLCDIEIITELECIDCHSNTQWNSCGGNPSCIANCDPVDNFCALDHAAGTQYIYYYMT